MSGGSCLEFRKLGMGRTLVISRFLAEDVRTARESIRDDAPWRERGFLFLGDARDGEAPCRRFCKTAGHPRFTSCPIRADGFARRRPCADGRPQRRGASDALLFSGENGPLRALWHLFAILLPGLLAADGLPCGGDARTGALPVPTAFGGGGPWGGGIPKKIAAPPSRTVLQ